MCTSEPFIVKYIKKHKKKLFGGIVTNTDPENFRGRWVVYNRSGKLLDSNNLDNWDTLQFQ